MIIQRFQNIPVHLSLSFSASNVTIFITVIHLLTLRNQHWGVVNTEEQEDLD